MSEKRNLVPRAFSSHYFQDGGRSREDPGGGWSRVTQNLGGRAQASQFDPETVPQYPKRNWYPVKTKCRVSLLSLLDSRHSSPCCAELD